MKKTVFLSLVSLLLLQTLACGFPVTAIAESKEENTKISKLPSLNQLPSMNTEQVPTSTTDELSDITSSNTTEPSIESSSTSEQPEKETSNSTEATTDSTNQSSENSVPASISTSETATDSSSDGSSEKAQKLTIPADALASGVFGTSQWYVGSDEILYIGEGTFPSYDGTHNYWSNYYKGKLYKVKFLGPVVLGAKANALFSGMGSWSVTEFENLSYLDVSHVNEGSELFSGNMKVVSFDTSSFDTSNMTDMSGMFFGCSSLTSLDLSHFDTSNVTNMSYMFEECSGLTSLDLSHFDTSNVTNMSIMFNNCKGLTSLDVSHFNTSNVTEMYRIFASCENLTTVDVSKFNTSNVTNMYRMFFYCFNLTSLDLSHFNTSNVTNMSEMFTRDYSLTNLDISAFDTSNVTNMSNMFSFCSGLKSLDISTFDTSKVTTFTHFFYSDVNLSHIKLGDKFNIIRATDTDLPEPPTTAPYVGKWQKDHVGALVSSEDLMTSKTSADWVGDWYWAVKAEAKPVTVKYVDANGTEIHTSQTITGALDSAYDATTAQYKLTIPGYTLDTTKLPANGTGKITGEPQTVTYYYKKNAAAITLHFVDADGVKLREDVVINPDKASTGDAYDFTNKYKDYDGAFTAHYLYQKSEGPVTGTWSEQPQEITYVYNGSLEFTQAPKTISFGAHSLSGREAQIGLADIDQDLLITDYRGLKAHPSWQVSGMLLTEFTGNQMSDELTDILYYNSKPMTLGTSLLVKSQETVDHQAVDISKEWDNALKLQVAPGKARAEAYQATIQWNLSDSVANK